LTEMYFSDWGNSKLEERQTDMIERMFELVKTMPYVKTIHFFRLYAPDEKDVDTFAFNAVGEHFFGMFEKDENGNWRPRKKVYTLQKIYGEKGML